MSFGLDSRQASFLAYFHMSLFDHPFTCVFIGMHAK